MAWRIVKQPDGRYARWSDIVDGFTHVDLTRLQAVNWCALFLSPRQAEEKVQAADDNPGRWDECQRLIRELK